MALLRWSASARAEVSAPCGWRSAPATHVAVHCANPRSDPFFRSFHRSTDAEGQWHRPLEEEEEVGACGPDGAHARQGGRADRGRKRMRPRSPNSKTSSARNDFAVRAAVAHAYDMARACRLTCAIGYGRRARHLDSGSRATSRSRAHQRKWSSRTHTSFSVFVSNNTNTNKKLKRQYDHQSGMGGSQSAALRRTQSSHVQIR